MILCMDLPTEMISTILKPVPMGFSDVKNIPVFIPSAFQCGITALTLKVVAKDKVANSLTFPADRDHQTRQWQLDPGWNFSGLIKGISAILF